MEIYIHTNVKKKLIILKLISCEISYELFVIYIHGIIFFTKMEEIMLSIFVAEYYTLIMISIFIRTYNK